MAKKYQKIMKTKVREMHKGIIINKIGKAIYKTIDEDKILTEIFQKQQQHKIWGSNIYKIKMLRQ